MKSIISGLDKAFNNRVRLGIMSVLRVNEHLDFRSLKELLNVTDGNLASHLKALEKEQYIIVEKSFIDRKPNTRYLISTNGINAFNAHLEGLVSLLKQTK